MSLRDRLRGRSAAPQDVAHDGMSGDPPSGDVDVSDFAPRPDGDYHNAERGLILRFARPAVTETDAEHGDAAHGEFTAAGRFVVQRPFGRAVVYTVLGGERSAYDVVLTVRRTDTGTGTSERLDFAFEPDRG